MTEEERRARIHHHTYETCEGIQEHAERIVALEELVLESQEFAARMFDCWIEEVEAGGNTFDSERNAYHYELDQLCQRALGLGIEVPE